MNRPASAQPTILVPYREANCGGACQDVFLYLRPETNGIEVESRMMRVVQQTGEYRDAIELAYLANFPGSFILGERIIERHYAVRIFFARHGLAAFTPYMKEAFQAHFGVDPERVDVLGAFEAVDRLNMSPAELFGLWVPSEDMIVLCGQSIKRKGSVYIVNYDIPAILAKNSIDTDIAVMIFRTSLTYTQIHQLVASVGDELLKSGLLRKDVPLSRAFHYSKGPFEQILDAAGYLYRPDGGKIPVSSAAFYRYLAGECGFSDPEIIGALDRPIMRFGLGGSRVVEEEIFAYTQDDTFAEAGEKLGRVVAQLLCPGKSRFETATEMPN